jgi:peptidylprolyl isomerase
LLRIFGVKHFAPIAALCLLLALAACGEDAATEKDTSSDETRTASSDETRSPDAQPVTIGQIPNLPPPKKSNTTSAQAIASRPEPKVTVPSGPPPQELLVGDLITGVGPAAEKGDRVGLRWVAYDYETGEQFETSWGLTRDTLLGAGEVNEGWEEGLPGMKVGGWRKLIVPTQLTQFQEQPLVYVVSMLWLKREAS